MSWISNIQKKPITDEKGNVEMKDVSVFYIKGSIPGLGMMATHSELTYEVNDKTKYFLDSKECKKTDFKSGYRLVIDGRPALTVKAFKV